MMKKFRNDAAIQFAQLAKEFTDAAKLLNEHYKQQRSHPSWPTYQVACQALELYLKSFLRATGVPLTMMKRNEARHNLPLLLRWSRMRGLNKHVRLAKTDEKMIAILNRHYHTHDFRYKAAGEFTLVHVSKLISLLDRMDSPVFGFCVRAG